MKYAGFWRRLGAMLLDLLVLSPLIALTLWGSEQSRLFYLYYLVPGLLFGLWFSIYLVKRYGGTPGKLLLGIRITRLDGSELGYKEAVFRHSVTFLLSIPASLLLAIGVLDMSDAEYFAMGYLERTTHIISLNAELYTLSNIVLNVWVYSEFIVMLTNKRRRAIHDFMAGTVVIKKQVEPVLVEAT
jgi:uncharacterized RDD family membrane protein YckC